VLAATAPAACFRTWLSVEEGEGMQGQGGQHQDTEKQQPAILRTCPSSIPVLQLRVGSSSSLMDRFFL
jgi:hypothetical protein